MKELGTAKFILGMENDRDMTAGTLTIKQTRYIDDVVERFCQQNTKPVDNPCPSRLKLSKFQSPRSAQERDQMRSRPYRSLICCLLNITTCTRPNIVYVVTQLSRFHENPGLQHWKGGIRVLRYMKTTGEHGINYGRGTGTGNLTGEAFTDTDWGSNIDDRRSVSSIMVIIGSAPVVFKSKFQRTVALSSAESEYVALSLCVQEVLWTRAMLQNMSKEQADATQIWEDNPRSIAQAAGYHATTKNVDIHHHFTRENVERGTAKIDYVESKHQLADILTKALRTKTLKYVRGASSIKAKATA